MFVCVCLGETHRTGTEIIFAIISFMGSQCVSHPHRGGGGAGRGGGGAGGMAAGRDRALPPCHLRV